MKQGGAILPEALRWLWRGYPAPIVVREPPQMKEAGWDPRAKGVFDSLARQGVGAGWRELWRGGEPDGR